MSKMQDATLQEIRKVYPTFTRHFFKSNQKGMISSIRRAVKTSWQEKIEDFKKAVVNGDIEIDVKTLGKADKDFLQKLGFEISEDETESEQV